MRGTNHAPPSVDEDALFEAIKQIREDAGTDLTIVAVMNSVQQDGAFAAVTLAQVRQVDRKVKLALLNAEHHAAHSSEVRLDYEEDGDATLQQLAEDYVVSPDHCAAYGDGLREATVKQVAHFEIEACDSKGRRMPSGGDKFYVAVRGPAHVHARIRDHEDGTYGVSWKPTTSGYYNINVSHLGVLISGSPFTCLARPTLPCPSKCIVRGEHLTTAMSRATHNFEVLFKDKLGQVAHAVDLDVFVEPVAPTSPRNRGPPQAEETAATEEAVTAVGQGETSHKKKKGGKHNNRSQSKAQASPAVELPPVPLPPPQSIQELNESAMSAAAAADKFQKEGMCDITTRYRMMRVKVGDRPLLVRERPDKESEQVGRLLPGQIVTIVEERVAEDGEVRACIALDSISTNVDTVGTSPFRSLATRSNGASDAVLTRAGEAGHGNDKEVESDSLGNPSRDSEKPGDVEEPLSKPIGGLLQPRSPSLPLGWVTLVKPEGTKLVTSRLKLRPSSRRQYVQQWARRKANDRAEAYKGGRTINELQADPSGIGFGFGGVEPGTIHAKGQLHEVHRVSYSIGLAGQYLLHVRLRQQAIALPGSPFMLTVQPGAAHAKSTSLPADVLNGKVGTGPETGCSQELRTADKMGNMCIVGGARVTIVTDSDDVESDVIDRGDGTYQLKWHSTSSGHFKTRILIDGEDVLGSPTSFSLTSCNPDISKSALSGDGLKTATAGNEGCIKIKFVDQFSNTAMPTAEFKFGMSIGKDKDKLANVKPHEFVGEWEPGNTGIYVMKYTPTQAGNNELHLWCDPNSKGERVAFPGSPFHTHIGAGAASATVSHVDGWQKLYKEEKNDKYAKSGAADPQNLVASDTVSIKPQIFDLFGNPTVLPEGELRILHSLPDGTSEALSYTTQVRSGATAYDIRHDTTMAGNHSVSITLNDTPIKGSPVNFVVLPDKPDPAFCKLKGPSDEVLYTNTNYTVMFNTFDKFGNKCISGGLTLGVKPSLIKQGVHDQTNLVVNNNHFYSCDDNGDGTYTIHLEFKIMCTIRLVVNMDKNLQGNAGELTLQPHMHFVPNPDDDDGDERGSSPSNKTQFASKSSKSSGKLKAAASEVIEGFGNPEERREKDAIIVAAEGFAEGSKDFVFDKDTSKAARKGAPTPIKRGASDTPVSPNPNLFDKGVTQTPSSKSKK